MKILKVNLYVLITIFLFSCSKSENLTGNWSVTKMEPTSDTINIQTVMAAKYGNKETISDVYITKDSIVFFNSDKQSIVSSGYGFDKVSGEISLYNFPVKSKFLFIKKESKLRMIIGGFTYEFTKAD